MDIWIETEPILGEATFQVLFYDKSEIVNQYEGSQGTTVNIINRMVQNVNLSSMLLKHIHKVDNQCKNPQSQAVDIWIETEPILGEAIFQVLFYDKSEILNQYEGSRGTTVNIFF